MKAKRFLFSAFFVLMLHFSTPVSAQQGSGFPLVSEFPVNDNSPRFSMQAGSMFTTGLAGSSMFMHSLAPAINWDISRRFSLEVGTILSSTHMHGANPFFPYTPHMAGGESIAVLGQPRMYQSTFYAMGAYQVSPRLTLTGGTWMDRNNMAEMTMSPQAFNMNAHGANLGFDYRVTENFRFGAEVSVSSGYNPLNPFYFNQHGTRHNSMFHSPAPFHRFPRW